MIILLVLYFLFVFVYLGVNFYIIFKVNSLRIKGDATGGAILIYLSVMAAILVISLIYISNLDWNYKLEMPSTGGILWK